MCIFNERVILPSISRRQNCSKLANIPVYSGDSVVPQEADWLHPDVDSTQVQVSLSDSFHKEKIWVFIFHCNVYELKQKERKNL